MRAILFGLAALVLLAVGVVTWQGTSRRPEPHLVTPADPAPVAGSNFVIREAAPPPSPPPGPAAPPAPDLDAVMQRLRNTQPTPAALPAPAPPPSAPDVVVVTPATPPPTDPGPRWTEVSSQGVRWRLNRGADLSLSIDLGNGQVADVHVQSAFAALDQAAVNARVDYLKQTIIDNFSPRSARYSFGRDGSLALAP